jgi:hypothetical protein
MATAIPTEAIYRSSNLDDTDANIDMLVAEELNTLSLKEREKVLHDIHGVADPIDEVPELVERSLVELDNYLNVERRQWNTAAYNLAESRSPEYVKSRKIRLMFLRASRFDSSQAAGTMLQFFEKKLELFGPSKLCKDITLDDLSSADIECMENGHLQFLPARDRAGRCVLVVALPFLTYREHENHVSHMPPRRGAISEVALLIFLDVLDSQPVLLNDVSFGGRRDTEERFCLSHLPHWCWPF